MKVFEGVLHFPAELFVASGALAKTYDIAITGINATLTFPSLRVDGKLGLVPPEPLQPARVEALAQLEWGYVSIEQTQASYVSDALLRFSVELSPLKFGCESWL